MIAEGHHAIRSIRFHIHLPRQQTPQQQVTRPAEVLERRHHRPAGLCEQPDGWLLTKLVFGVGMAHGWYLD
jgi:hypothetical protein